MNKDLEVALRITANNRDFLRKMQGSRKSVAQFSDTTTRGFKSIKNSSTSLTRAFASLGLTISATMAIVTSAKFDKQLTKIAQTAGVAQDNINDLRGSLFDMARQTGQSLKSLTSGFDDLIQAGLNWDEARATIEAINRAMAVTGAEAKTLASGMTVAAEAFQFDLSNPQLAVRLLDQMTVAGRLGNAELADLSGVFSRIGINAKTANLSFSETLGLVERLSLIEKNPERLATLVDSTLRLFTNQAYLTKAAKAAKVSFYDADGERRAALDVLDDIAKKYKGIKKDINKDRAIQQLFGQADLDTIKGLRALLSGETLNEVRKMAEQISSASDVIQKDLPGAISNSIDQAARLKSVLREAADGFSRPINRAISNVIKYVLDKKEAGGLEASGTDLMLGAGAAVGGALLAKRYGGSMIKGLTGKLGNIAGGVATGKALEQAAGVLPVYVVNMPASLGGMPGGASVSGGAVGGLPKNMPKVVGKTKAAAGLLYGAKNLSTIGAMGAGAMGTAGAAGVVAAAVGYGIGTLINKAIEGSDLSNKIGEAVAHALAALGNKEAKLVIEINEKRAEVKRIEADGFEVEVDTGRIMVGP
jgi:TP901 family phage tail tape measure protein